MSRLHQGYCYPNNFLILFIVILSATFTMFVLVDHASSDPVNAYTMQDNPVVVWNMFTTNTSLEHNLSPPSLARAYALVHISIYDALLSSKNIDNFTDREKEIVAGAASEVLAYLFPDMKDKINNFSSIQIMPSRNETDGSTVSTSEPSKAFQHGHSVGKQVVLYAKNDGSDAVFNGTIPQGQCKWTGTNPSEPTAGEWKTFILTSGDEIQPPPPIECNSEEYKKQVQEIVDASKNRTAKQIRDIHLWGDTPPPTIWNNILNDNMTYYGLSIMDSARASSYLNVGMYDAGVSTWYTKFKYWTERPFQAAPDLVTVIPIPNFLGYTSGHSTLSGTAENVG